MICNYYTQEEFNVPEFVYSLNSTDREYRNLLVKILKYGIWKENRTGTRAISLFGPQLEFSDVGNKFPLLTTKRIHLKSVIGELLWFLSGSTDKNVLKEKYGTSIWDEWNAPNPKFDGDMGPIYGHQWVNWTYIEESFSKDIVNNSSITTNPISHKTFIEKSINQLQNIIHKLKVNPDDRRMIVSAWNVPQLDQMALPPCHWSYQFDTRQYPNQDKRTLSIKMNIRSWDVFLGGPFNISSYAILLLMIAQEVNMIPGNLYISAGDAHLYKDHLEYIFKQMNRSSKGAEPIMKLNPDKGFWDFEPEDFTLEGYDPHPNWKNIPIAV